MKTINLKCDALIADLRRPYKSFVQWAVDGLTGKGWDVKIS